MLLNIHSKYLIQNVLNFLTLKKQLKIMKYNKQLQERSQYSLKDYKDFYYVEFEIIPVEYLQKKEIFVNNTKPVDISFTKLNNEIIHSKNNFLAPGHEVKKINISFSSVDFTFSRLFYDCACIKEIKILKFHRDDVKDMSYMFYACKNLKKINFCSYCKNLAIFFAPNFVGKKTIDISNMFYYYSKLRYIDLSHFSITCETIARGLFGFCFNLSCVMIKNIEFHPNVDKNEIFSFCNDKLIFHIGKNVTKLCDILREN